MEFAEQLRYRIQLFAAGGGVITPTELAREMIKGLSSCPNILEPAKNSMVLIKTNGSAVKFSEIATTWKQWEQLYRGTGIYQPRLATAYVSRAREERPAAQVSRQPMDEREFRSDLGGAPGEASGAKAAATMNTAKEKSAKRVEGEYVRFFVRDKNGDGPPDVPKQAILQDGMY